MPNSVPPAMDQVVEVVETMVTCPKCHKKKRRECDLRKHMKRHERPYGCTFPYCFKRFGSRNDWKRHESSQHFHQEMWRCSIECAAGATCGFVFYYHGLAEDHLRLVHKQKADEVAMERMHIGANAHDKYWCGFCGCLIKQESTSMHHNNLEARYKHIGDHFDKDRHIEDWICVEARRLKGGLAAEHRHKTRTHGRSKYHEDDSDPGDSGIPNQRGQTALAATSSSSWQALDPAIATTRDPAYTCHNGKRRRTSVPDYDLDDADGVSDEEFRDAS
ncbi:hypothetical protein LTR78_004642 [Recurvomyces mirabilis]|uniref:C2H2-type domain-containing protein n=2 Tax=Recurvomyces mirabilis TaxID=574656 RepID=A0AAE0WPM2_9PEZI|nr:hypothetical protein LTR78_004642 [Recurvomyces mirabilis]